MIKIQCLQKNHKNTITDTKSRFLAINAPLTNAGLPETIDMSAGTELRTQMNKQKLTFSTIMLSVALASSCGPSIEVPQVAADTHLATEKQNKQSTICGSNNLEYINDFTPRLGFSTAFAQEHKAAVGRLNIKLSDGTWAACSGTLISPDEFITAGHCVDGIAVPLNGYVEFNYARYAGSTNLEPITKSNLTSIEETDSWFDYAILKLAGNVGASFPYARIRTSEPVDQEPIALIAHPNADPMMIDVGHADIGPLSDSINYDDVDTLGGSSGGGILDANGLLVGVHHTAGCGYPLTSNYGSRMSKIWANSSLLRDMFWPNGNVDGLATDASGVYITGWGYDTDTPSNTINVHMYFDGRWDSSPFSPVVAATDQYRADVNAANGLTGSHGFKALIPSGMYDGHLHSAFVYAIDNNNIKNGLIWGSGRSSFAVARGNFEEVTSSGNLKGWTYDVDTPTTSVAVHIYFDGPYGSSSAHDAFAITTNTTRSDVNIAYGITGTHGFEVSVPTALRDGQPHSAYLYSIDADGNVNSIIPGSPKGFILY